MEGEKEKSNLTVKKTTSVDVHEESKGTPLVLNLCFFSRINVELCSTMPSYLESPFAPSRRKFEEETKRYIHE